MTRVLVVEDDLAIRKPVVDLLTEEGFTVDAAGDGLEALAHLRNSLADVIILDLMMPRMSGEGFMAARQRDPKLARIPVIVATGVPCAKIEGADVLLRKPFEFASLLESMQRCVVKQRLQLLAAEKAAPDTQGFA